MLKQKKLRNVDENHIAVLIDSENVSAKNIEFIMKESLKYGLLTIKRIYGDWTDTKLVSWKNTLPGYAIQPIQQFRNTSGKNSTDSSLIIDAMDILYTGDVDCFIIVSSDSDFTRLAIRLRESGKFVVGIGEEKTPKSLVNACNEFNYIEIIEKRFEGIKKNINKNKSIGLESTGQESSNAVLLNLIYEAFNMVDQEKEEKNVSKLGNAIRKLDPGFDPQTYGFQKFSLLLKSLGEFQVTLDKDKRTYFVREKVNKNVVKK